MPLIAFLLGAAFVVYVLIGYPLLVALRARWFPRPLVRGARLRSVSVLIPVYNGAEFVPAKLESVLGLDYPRELLEIHVVSDGSTDSTGEAVGAFAARGVHFVELPRGGKAAALNHAMRLARHEILLMTDIRQPLAPDCLRRLAACFEDPSVGVVSGEVVVREGTTSQEADVGLFRRYESWIRGNLSRSGSLVGATGCLYAVRRELAREIPPGTLLDDVYLPVSVVLAGYRCVFEPRARAYDYPTALETEFRRKVRTQAGIYQLVALRPRLLLPSAIWLRFVSLKLGRLLLPYGLLAMGAAAAWGLPAGWAVAALGGQAAFYLLALADVWAGEGSGLKRLSSPARSFVVLVAAALCGASVLLVPCGALWGESAVGRGRAGARAGGGGAAA